MRSNEVKYFFSDPNVIVTPPDKKISLPSVEVSFDLDTEQLERMLKAGVYHPCLCVVGEAGVVKLQVRDKKNDTSNDFSIIVGETESEFFSTSR